jgi:hypothetical protein
MQDGNFVRSADIHLAGKTPGPHCIATKVYKELWIQLIAATHSANFSAGV